MVCKYFKKIKKNLEFLNDYSSSEYLEKKERMDELLKNLQKPLDLEIKKSEDISVEGKLD